VSKSAWLFGAGVALAVCTHTVRSQSSTPLAGHYPSGQSGIRGAVTPDTRFDYQVQFTVWSASGRFSPGAHNNRGTGFWSLVYSLGSECADH
jgi:hypothetical protein